MGTHFLPEEKWDKIYEYYLLPTNNIYGAYLWHAFSYGLLNGLCEAEARLALRKTPKNDAILVTAWNNEASLYIPDASNITPELWEQAEDIVLTSSDFSWTYAKPHEPDFGPYFYQTK